MTTHPPATVPRTYNAIAAALPTDGLREDFTTEYHAAEGVRAGLLLEEWGAVADTLADPAFHAYAAAALPGGPGEAADREPSPAGRVEHWYDAAALSQLLAEEDWHRGPGRRGVLVIDPATGRRSALTDPAALARIGQAVGRAVLDRAILILPGGDR